MAEQKQDDQQEPSYNNFVSIQDIALKTYRKRWTIERGGGRESGISVLMARNDDDDDEYHNSPSTKISLNNPQELLCH